MTALRNSIPDEDPAGVALVLDAPRLLRLTGVALVSAVLGIGIGLAIAWVWWPVEYTNADLVDLRQRHKDEYVRMISAAYVANGNLPKAQARLKVLGINFTAKYFNDFLGREQKAGHDPATLDGLALFAQGMGIRAQVIPTPTPAAANSSETLAVPIQAVASFQLIERTVLGCAEEPNEPHLRFMVRDALGKELPNIAIEIRWANGEDTVYTGLKPERGLGYADLEATPGTFSVAIPNTDSDVAGDLRIGESPANCRNDRGATPRGWKLIFQQK